MGKLQEFLLANDLDTNTEKEVTISGFPFPFVIKTITEGENKAIRKRAQTVTRDRKTNQKIIDYDTDRYNAYLLEACVVEPNLKDAELQEKYGVMGAGELLDKIMKPGQYMELLSEILDLNGFNDMNELIDDAKNSSTVEE